MGPPNKELTSKSVDGFISLRWEITQIGAPTIDDAEPSHGHVRAVRRAVVVRDGAVAARGHVADAAAFSRTQHGA